MISLAELTTFPQFPRFNNFRIWYSASEFGFTSALIEKKYKFIESYLLALKSALNDSNMIEFNADIYEHSHSYFSNHLQLLDYLRYRFLPVFFNSSHRYKFNIHFSSDGNSSAKVVASILQIPQIERCSNVEIEVNNGEQKLPVDAISNWLEKSVDGMKNNKGQKKRFLKVIFPNEYWQNSTLHAGIQNAGEMLDHLRTVI